jgi:antitoxin (DNA-binding transcriptional repressor) of toxin-antitoxin stability system
MDVPVTGTDPALADLVRRVEAGEEVMLTRDGMPVAQVVAVPVPRPASTPEERGAALDRFQAKVRALNLPPGPPAVRCSDFLYDENGLPA